MGDDTKYVHIFYSDYFPGFVIFQNKSDIKTFLFSKFHLFIPCFRAQNGTIFLQQNQQGLVYYTEWNLHCLCTVIIYLYKLLKNSNCRLQIYIYRCMYNYAYS